MSDAPADSSASGPIDPEPRRWWVLVGVGSALLAINLDLTVVNLALPIIGRAFHAGMSDQQWITSTTSITFAAAIAPAGKSADQFGHRRIFLAGMVVYLAGSLLAGFAPGMPALTAGRLLQGLGSAGIFITAFTLTNLHFPARQNGFAVGLLMLFTGAAMAMGPTVGGYLVEYASWRWAFLLNVPICLGSVLLVRYACEADRGQRGASIHYPSAALLTLAFFLLILACNEGSRWGLGSGRFNVVFAAGSLTLAITLYWQTRLRHPLLDLDLHRRSTYRLVTLIRLPFQITVAGLFFALPLYLQNVRALPAADSGLLLLSMTAAVAVTSPLAGKLCDSVGATRLILAASAVGFAGYALLALFAELPQTWRFASALALVGVQMGLMFSASNHAAIASLPANRKGAGFGLFLAITFLVYSIGIAASGYVLTKTGASEFQRLAEPHATLSDVANHSELARIVSGGQPVADMMRLAPKQADLAVSIGAAAALEAFSTLMWIFAGLSLVGLPLCVALRGAGQDTAGAG